MDDDFGFFMLLLFGAFAVFVLVILVFTDTSAVNNEQQDKEAAYKQGYSAQHIQQLNTVEACSNYSVKGDIGVSYVEDWLRGCQDSVRERVAK